MVSCRVLVPKYWTDLSTVSFSFTAFADSGTGIRGYEWGLGFEPNQTNVAAFRPFDGTVVVCGCPLMGSPSLWLACTHPFDASWELLWPGCSLLLLHWLQEFFLILTMYAIKPQPIATCKLGVHNLQ